MMGKNEEKRGEKMEAGQEKELKISLAPHTLETLEEASEKKGMSLQVLTRLIMNEWALRYEQQKKEKDR